MKAMSRSKAIEKTVSTPPPETPEKDTPVSLIAHLSPGQIEEVYQRYLAGDKASNLIKDFNIKKNLRSILPLLPPIQRMDLTCPYCSSTAKQQRKSKTGMRPVPYCTGCPHVYAERDKWCLCDGCRIEYITTLNGDECLPPVSYSSLTIREKILLMSAISLSGAWHVSNFSFYQWQRKDRKYAPTRAYHAQCQSELFARKIILVSYETSNNQLHYAREFNTVDFLLWIPNIAEQDSTYRLTIDELKIMLTDDLKSIGEEATETLSSFLHELAMEELMEYVDNLVKMTPLVFKSRSQTRTVLESLLPSKSLNSLYMFVWQAVKSANSAFAEKRIAGATSAGNSIPMNISMAAECYQSNRTKSTQSDFERICKLKSSEIAHTVYGVILKDHDGAFRTPLPQYIENIMIPTLQSLDR